MTSRNRNGRWRSADAEVRRVARCYSQRNRGGVSYPATYTSNCDGVSARCHGAADGHGHEGRSGARSRNRVGAECNRHAAGLAAGRQSNGVVEAIQRGGADRGGAAVALLHGHRRRRGADGEVRIAAASAISELEVRDTGGPVERAGGFYVLLGKPEGAIVNRIDLHGAVVAPAIAGAFLNAGAGDDVEFRFHGSGRIARSSAGNTHGRIKSTGGTDDAEADGLVTGGVHGGRAHPAIRGIRRERTLLRDGGSAVGILDFIPADPGGISDGVVEADRFVGAEVAIEETIHRAVR